MNWKVPSSNPYPIPSKQPITTGLRAEAKSEKLQVRKIQVDKTNFVNINTSKPAVNYGPPPIPAKGSVAQNIALEAKHDRLNWDLHNIFTNEMNKQIQPLQQALESKRSNEDIQKILTSLTGISPIQVNKVATQLGIAKQIIEAGDNIPLLKQYNQVLTELKNQQRPYLAINENPYFYELAKSFDNVFDEPVSAVEQKSSRRLRETFTLTEPHTLSADKINAIVAKVQARANQVNQMHGLPPVKLDEMEYDQAVIDHDMSALEPEPSFDASNITDQLLRDLLLQNNPDLLDKLDKLPVLPSLSKIGPAETQQFEEIQAEKNALMSQISQILIPIVKTKLTVLRTKLTKAQNRLKDNNQQGSAKKKKYQADEQIKDDLLAEINQYVALQRQINPRTGHGLKKTRGRKSEKVKVALGQLYDVDTNMLDQNILCITYRGNIHKVTDFPNMQVSNEFQRALLDVLRGAMPKVNQLSPIEFNLLKRLLKRSRTAMKIAPQTGSGLGHYKCACEHNRMGRSEMHKRLNILLGEIDSGNDNPHVLKELKGLTNDMLDSQAISSVQALKISQLFD